MNRLASCTVGLATVVLALTPVLVIGGCGSGKTASDPFVGTWRHQPGHGPNAQTPLVITRAARAGDRYVATWVYWGPGEKPASPRPTLAIPMTRHGDKLTGTFGNGVTTLRAEIVYLPDSGHLTWANSRTATSPLNKPDVMVKVSAGTAYPTTP